MSSQKSECPSAAQVSVSDRRILDIVLSSQGHVCFIALPGIGKVNQLLGLGKNVKRSTSRIFARVSGYVFTSWSKEMEVICRGSPLSEAPTTGSISVSVCRILHRGTTWVRKRRTILGGQDLILIHFNHFSCRSST
jgi:hypothetical protein